MPGAPLQLPLCVVVAAGLRFDRAERVQVPAHQLAIDVYISPLPSVLRFVEERPLAEETQAGPLLGVVGQERKDGSLQRPVTRVHDH